MPRVGRIALHLLAAAAIGVAVWLLLGRTAFVNYDSAWSLDWMRQLLAGGSRPDLERLFSPTPHPLSDLLSGVLVPFSDGGGPAVGHGAETVLIALALFWLGALGVVTYRLGEAWFGVGAGIVAAILVLTREPVLSYGLRTYLDLPYAVFLLLALLAETRRPRNGLRTLGWITLAGLLRPEAWLLAAAYVGYLLVVQVREAGSSAAGTPDDGRPATDDRTDPGPTADAAATDAGGLLRAAPRERLVGWWRVVDRRQLALLVAIAAIAPLGWIVEGLVLAGDPLQALTGTQQNAADLDRVTGVGSAITVMPRRLGEIVREPVLLAAFGGVILSLLLLRRRALLGVAATIAAGIAFFLLAAAGLPLLTRYLVFPGTLLVLFAAAGLLGWRRLDRDHRWRRPWQAFALLCLLVLVAFGPGQVRRVDRLHHALGLQQRVIGDLRTVTGDLRPLLTDGPCVRPENAGAAFGQAGESPDAGARRVPADVALPNHRAVPQVLLWLGLQDDQPFAVEALAPGTAPAVTLLPASTRVARGFILDKADKGKGLPDPPSGSVQAATVGSWRVYGRDAACAAALRTRLGR
ncbi:hypothetical protein PAI11_18390 [Patulibacter medicamentivorans]|uniref:Glycosyltransferase RgtA/B/C/D-like domain-containing protein n=1 Tax=Patulibacter medicamentivorans TaxID=1097667 RepID=H0E4V8_9ACTN|nr:hypothetical protein [Patulibacter medicamentivorans]EHN11285.1 hypothetical protein PAI11_18390 [Patulibacter medicamentivorans]